MLTRVKNIDVNKRNEIINECWAEIGKGAENTVSWLIKKHSEI